MELQFEHTKNIGAGVNPASIHFPNNEVWLFNVSSGRLKAKKWLPVSGDVDWSSPNFTDETIATSDKALSLYRLKNIPRVGAFGAWHQDEIEVNGRIISNERQRLGIWDAVNDLTDFLQSGNIQLDADNIVSSASFTFKNPSHQLSGESMSRLIPSKKIELFFTAGDSEDYPMGVFYIDKVDVQINSGLVTVDCRNISGKVLKDQTIDGDNVYPKDVYAYTVEDFLDKAGIEDYDIQQPADPLTAWQLGMEFPPEMDRLTGLNELIRASLNWVIRETLDGEIIAGSEVSYQPIKDMVGTYTFNRGTDLISRSVERDDANVYSKICCQSKDTTTEAMIRKTVAVDNALEWSIAPNKTLYVNLPDDVPEIEIQERADLLASRMGFLGVMESFSGPFRPHIMPNDEAEIISVDGTKYLGVITTVNHRFGENGFFTDFTVDSGGMKGKPNLKDIIAKIGETADTTVKRIF